VTWQTTLAEMDTALDEIEAAVSSEWSEPILSTWTEPHSVGAISGELREAALDRLRRIAELEAAIVERQRAVVAQLSADARRDPRRAATPASIIDWRV
jgi:hypothetical protein